MIYLSGPMTGWPENNHPLFDSVTEWLRNKGHIVINPAENFAGRLDVQRHVLMRLDISNLLQCTRLALLPDWELSPGARLEVRIAEELKLDFYLIDRSGDEFDMVLVHHPSDLMRL